MGFRDLTLFNKALLAKQVWRMLSDPNSLTAKVFKARYHKHTDIMNATLGSNPSYIWLSLYWSREILNRGILWKVGNGEEINVFQDKWIPELKEGRITSNLTESNSLMVR